jgi:hypothetical protein
MLKCFLGMEKLDLAQVFILWSLMGGATGIE